MPWEPLTVVYPDAGAVRCGSFTGINRALWLAHVRALEDLVAWQLPLLYESGVRWAPEPWAPRQGRPSGVEEFAPPTWIYARGWGDCDDVAPWRSAERVLYGGLPLDAVVPIALPSSTGVHVVVYDRRDGSIEDPSRLLGMPGA
jgi:hypothetical protein